MPTIIGIRSIWFFFFSREGVEPPHIHVEEKDRYAKFWLSPVAVAASRGFRSHELTEVSRLVKDNRELFEEK
jgi:hypothetical protein